MTCILPLSRFSWVGLLLLALPAFSMDLLVSTNADAGMGSLRQAVLDNNALGGGNTIVFSNTVIGTIVLTGGELLINRDVTIVGPGPDVLAVSGNNASRVFRITNAVATISGLSIINGRVNGASGGGILNYGTLRLNQCTVSNCAASVTGGGIDNWFQMTIVGSSIINNQSIGYASALDGSMRLTNCTVAGNVGFVAVGGGTVIWNTTIANNMGRGMYGGSSPATLVGNSILAGNTDVDVVSSFSSAGYNLIGKGDQATGFTGLGDQVGSTNSPLNPNLRPLGFHGGGTPTMPPLPGSLAIDQGRSFGLTTNDQRGRLRTFDDPGAFNATLGDGTDIGAVEVRPGYVVELLVTSTNDSGAGSLRQAIFRASTFEYDVVTFGPYVTDTIRLTSGELVIDKTVGIEGPGWQWFGGPPARKLTISGNNSSRVFSLIGGNVSLSGLTIANGMAIQGAGVHVSGGRQYIFGCHMISNTASQFGGGLSVSGGQLLIENSSLTHNQALLFGGGIYCGSTDFFDILNCTIASNRTTYIPDGLFFPRGGGIAVTANQFVSVSHSTVAGNSSTYQGGGIDNAGFTLGKVFIENTLVANNLAPNYGPDVAGPIVSSDYNLVGNTNNATGFSSLDLLNVNPLLGPLGAYGGPTPSMALRAGSPAIDKGKAYTAEDQRGFARVVDDPSVANASGGDGTDIGAFEVDSKFRIVDFRRVGTDVALGLMSVLDRNYRAEYTNNLPSGAWTVFTNNVPGNGHVLWVTNYGGANQPQRFYRGAVFP